MARRDEIIQEIKYRTVLAKDPDAQAIELELCRRDPVRWLKSWVYTMDPHDKVKPYKRLPQKEYLYEVAGIWQREPMLLIPKSRQMMISWLIIALYLHDTQFFPGRLTVFQSKKNTDATKLVERAKVIFERQPAWMQQEWKYRRVPYGELVFPAIGSSIVGIPQGEDQVRQFTLSGLFIDEAAFQPKMKDTWTAAKPTVDKGDCRVTMASSANPSFFEQLVHDKGGRRADI